MPGVEILKAIRHNRKLRTGTHKFNDFILTIRELSQPDEVADRLNGLTAGVPNYFGEQRFGNRNGNLFLGARLLDGETIRDRQKRSMAISALRSWLFNEFVSCRLAEIGSKQALDGDVMLLQGSNSFFCAEQWSDELQQRLQEGDIHFSAPMWGQGELASRAQALLFESTVASHHQALCEGLAALGLSQERRALMQYPEQLQWQIEGQQLQLSFRLQAGGFATAVTRELFNPTPHQD